MLQQNPLNFFAALPPLHGGCNGLFMDFWFDDGAIWKID
jgi:hypothetical protein